MNIKIRLVFIKMQISRGTFDTHATGYTHSQKTVPSDTCNGGEEKET